MSRLHDYGSNGQYGLEPSVLQNAPFDSQKRVGIRDVNLGETRVKRPRVVVRLSTMHHDNEGTFAANKVDQELKKSVDCEGFIDVAERIEVEGGVLRQETGERSCRI